MKLWIDGQCLQTASRLRGRGRYVQELIRAISEGNPQVELTIYYRRLAFCREFDLNLCISDYPRAEAVTYGIWPSTATPAVAVSALYAVCSFALCANHPRHYLGQCNSRTPVENLCRLFRITKRIHNIAGTNKGRVVIDVISPIKFNFEECCGYEFFKRVGDARSNNEVVGLVALKYSPHRFDVIGSPAPIAADREVAKSKPLSAAGTNPRSCRGDLAGHEAAWPKW